MDIRHNSSFHHGTSCCCTNHCMVLRYFQPMVSTKQLYSVTMCVINYSTRHTDTHTGLCSTLPAILGMATIYMCYTITAYHSFSKLLHAMDSDTTRKLSFSSSHSGFNENKL